MNALAAAYQFNAIVHQVDHPSMAQVFHEPIGSKPTIHLSFHLNEHYNSVRRGDDPIQEGVAAVKDYPIGHDLAKVKTMLKNMQLDLEFTGRYTKTNWKSINETNAIDKDVVQVALDLTGAEDPKLLEQAIKEVITKKPADISKVDV